MDSKTGALKFLQSYLGQSEKAADDKLKKPDPHKIFQYESRDRKKPSDRRRS